MKSLIISLLFIFTVSISFSQKPEDIINHFQNKIDSVESLIKLKRSSLEGVHTDGYYKKIIFELGYRYNDYTWHADTFYNFKEVRGIGLKRNRYSLLFLDNKPIRFTKNINPFSAYYTRKQRVFYLDPGNNKIYKSNGDEFRNIRRKKFIFNYAKENYELWLRIKEFYSDN